LALLHGQASGRFVAYAPFDVPLLAPGLAPAQAWRIAVMVSAPAQTKAFVTTLRCSAAACSPAFMAKARFYDLRYPLRERLLHRRT
jgi:hypothetical protein